MGVETVDGMSTSVDISTKYIIRRVKAVDEMSTEVDCNLRISDYMLRL